MKKQQLPSLVTILILTVMTIFFWIGIEVYRALTIKPPPGVSDEVLAPLDPNLDIDTLGNLEDKALVDEPL